MQIARMLVPAFFGKTQPRSIVVANAVRELGTLYVGSSRTIGREGPFRIVRLAMNAMRRALRALEHVAAHERQPRVERLAFEEGS